MREAIADNCVQPAFPVVYAVWCIVALAAPHPTTTVSSEALMNMTKSSIVRTLAAAGVITAFSTFATAADVTLSGASEVPAVTSSAAGTGNVTIKDDKSVTAKITVTGMTPTAAHIHMAAAGAN